MLVIWSKPYFLLQNQATKFLNYISASIKWVWGNLALGPVITWPMIHRTWISIFPSCPSICPRGATLTYLQAYIHKQDIPPFPSSSLRTQMTQEFARQIHLYKWLCKTKPTASWATYIHCHSWLLSCVVREFQYDTAVPLCTKKCWSTRRLWKKRCLQKPRRLSGRENGTTALPVPLYCQQTRWDSRVQEKDPSIRAPPTLQGISANSSAPVVRWGQSVLPFLF